MLAAVSVTHAEKNATAVTGSAATRPKATLDLHGFENVADRAAPIIGLVYGPVLCFFGFAWFAHIAQVLGFLAGGVLFSLGAFLIVQSYSSAAIVFLVFAFLCGGCLVGAIMRLRPAICTFAIGGGIGVALAYLIFFFAGLQLNNNDSPWLLLTGTALLILFGAIFLRYERTAIVLFSSMLGAYSWVYGVGYFAGRFPTWHAIYQRARASESHGAVPWTWWVYATALVVLLAWSLWEQCKRRERVASVSKRGTETDAYGDSDDGALATSPMPGVQDAPYQRV